VLRASVSGYLSRHGFRPPGVPAFERPVNGGAQRPCPAADYGYAGWPAKDEPVLRVRGECRMRRQYCADAFGSGSRAAGGEHGRQLRGGHGRCPAGQVPGTAFLQGR